jgi:type I restriction enzyme, S subunit
MTTKTLDELCDFIRGVTFDKADVSANPRADYLPILRAGNISRELDTRNDLVWVPSRNVSNEQKLKRDDIAICMSSGSPEVVGKTARVAMDYSGSVGSFCGIIRPKDPDVGAWVAYYFQSDSFRRHRDAIARGANIQNLRFSQFENIEIPMPGQQKRIAALLEKADRLRRTRRYACQLSDTFLQSVFLQIFGDPASNPKDWKIENLRSLCAKFSDGPFGSNLKSSHYTADGVRVIRLQNIGVGDFVDEDKAYIATSHFAGLSKHECLPGDVLIGTLGDPNLRACILPRTIPQALNKADCVQARVNDDRATRDYIMWLLNMPSTIHLAPGMINGETRSRISMGQLAVLPVPVPPLPLQQKFAAIVRRFERLRAQQREAERQAEHLFQTLLHRAFSSDL